jgi:hypothetical protein
MQMFHEYIDAVPSLDPTTHRRSDLASKVRPFESVRAHHKL